MTDQEKYVLSEIIRITGDSKSRTFWIKAIKEIGCSRVEQDLGELKYQTHKEEKRNPGAYLTTLLKQRMNLNTTAGKKATLTKPAEKLNTYFEKTQQDLFHHLMPIPIPKDEKGESGNMPTPYSGKNIPWPTFIGPEFFTLSTNKKKSDAVMYTPRSKEGAGPAIALIRGKISPDSKREYGIPTTHHWKVFSALQLAWSQEKCKFSQYDNGTLVCFIVVAAKELARLLGWKHWQHLGKNDLRWLKDIVTDLKSMPYYLRWENKEGLEGYGFYLVGDVSLINRKTSAGHETLFNVSFSSTVSWQLLERHAVIRPKQMLYVKSELASLIWLYLEPNLRANDKACINLSNLIKVLNLPEASWHKYKSQRKREFTKAIKEINGQRLADGRKMIVTIEKGLNDYQLAAHLEGYAIKQLED